MNIKKVKIKNFRNYEYQEINFRDGITVFFGNNAQGKTNILESIYLCSMGKSFRTNKEKELIKLGSNQALVEIEYVKSDREGKIRLELGEKKIFFSNGIKVNKLSEMIGKINVVLFTPDDIEIIKQGPALRRRFLDILISQLRPNYINCLNMYMKNLEQRNNYLRQIKYDNKPLDLLEIWDEKLVEYGLMVQKYRKDFLEKLKNKIKYIHLKVTEESENIDMEYITECKSNEQFLKVLKSNRNNDISKGYTTKGIQRDDFLIKINDKDVSIYGSQGQQRTAILSLKLAELKVIYDEIRRVSNTFIR